MFFETVTRDTNILPFFLQRVNIFTCSFQNNLASGCKELHQPSNLSLHLHLRLPVMGESKFFFTSALNYVIIYSVLAWIREQ